MLGNRFFYRPFHKLFFPNEEYEGLFFATTSALNICRFIFAGSATTAILLSTTRWTSNNEILFNPLALSLLLFLLVGSFAFSDWLPRILGTKYPESTLKRVSPIASPFLFLAFPLTYLFLKITRIFSKTIYLDTAGEPETLAKKELMSIIRQSSLKEGLDNNEKKLIASVLSFCEHLTREVMVPRVDVFTLESTKSIKEAAKLLEEEGYSRIPVYDETVDNIVGILMYKDILSKYMEYEAKNNDPAVLEAPISTIMKPVMYTPETKKISSLLQEFRKKQVHLAIVVDEYGGTDGIITIEDILEDIVGQIADEYDEEEALFVTQADGTWLVDARMSILDIEEQLGITIPEEGEYDTLAGYLFHCAGEIPPKGFIIDSDEFTLEVIKSNDRLVEKVRIRPKVQYDSEDGDVLSLKQD